MLNCQADTCIDLLESILSQDVMKICLEFINRTRERRHQKTMMRQIKKFEKLLVKTGGHSNNQSGNDGRNNIKGTNITDETTQTRETIEAAITTTVAHIHNNNNNRTKWVHNLSKTPLTEAQEKALARGPNFVITTKEPPVSGIRLTDRKSMPTAREREGRRAPRGNQTNPQENTAAQTQYHSRGSQSHRRAKKRQREGHINS